MAISLLTRPLCLLLGTVGLVQGLVFFALTLCAVLVHLCTITVSSDETFTAFMPLVVGLYFQGPDCQVYNTTIVYDYVSDLVKPEWLFIWMAVYVAVYGIWIISSALIMQAYFVENKTLHYVLLPWIILALANCGMDLALAVYFGFDFTDLLFVAEETGVILLPVVPIAMMILSLKGGVLWLINFFGAIFAVVAWNNFVNHKDDAKPLFLERAGFLDRNPIDGFAPIEVPRPTSLFLNSSGSKRQNVSTVSALRNYYLSHEESRSDLQSPIGETFPNSKWRKPGGAWDIPEPDYSPHSTVTRLTNQTDSKSPGLRHSLFNPTLPLRPSLKKTQQSFDRKEDISL